MACCYQCGKLIKGKKIVSSPPIFAIALGDFEKVFHPKCFEKAQNEAAKELGLPSKTLNQMVE